MCNDVWGFSDRLASTPQKKVSPPPLPKAGSPSSGIRTNFELRPFTLGSAANLRPSGVFYISVGLCPTSPLTQRLNGPRGTERWLINRLVILMEWWAVKRPGRWRSIDPTQRVGGEGGGRGSKSVPHRSSAIWINNKWTGCRGSKSRVNK